MGRAGVIQSLSGEVDAGVPLLGVGVTDTEQEGRAFAGRNCIKVGLYI